MTQNEEAVPARRRLGAYARRVLTGFAHTAICVGDVDEATRWYAEVLGLRVLSPPYEMAGEAIERDMGELVPNPVVVKAAIIGLGSDDRVLELIEYPGVSAPAATPDRPTVTHPGLTHLGLVCDDIVGTREELEQRGVGFLTWGLPMWPGCVLPGFTIRGEPCSS